MLCHHIKNCLQYTAIIQNSRFISKEILPCQNIPATTVTTNHTAIAHSYNCTQSVKVQFHIMMDTDRELVFQRSVPRRGQLHADWEPGAEEACLPLPDELRQESARHGHHGCEHLRQGLTSSSFFKVKQKAVVWTYIHYNTAVNSILPVVYSEFVFKGGDSGEFHSS